MCRLWKWLVGGARRLWMFEGVVKRYYEWDDCNDGDEMAWERKVSMVFEGSAGGKHDLHFGRCWLCRNLGYLYRDNIRYQLLSSQPWFDASGDQLHNAVPMYAKRRTPRCKKPHPPKCLTIQV